jgi:hypothetical protein
LVVVEVVEEYYLEQVVQVVQLEQLMVEPADRVALVAVLEQQQQVLEVVVGHLVVVQVVLELEAQAVKQ